MRETSLCHLLTDCVGNDEWLWKLHVLLASRDEQVTLSKPPAATGDGTLVHKLARCGGRVRSMANLRD